MRLWHIAPLALLAMVAAAAARCALSAGDDAPAGFDAVRAAYCPSDVRLLDRHGAVLHELRVDPHRRRLAWTPLTAVSPALVDAILASEDHRFFAHTGVDWRAAAAALWQRLHGGPLRGASTLSMQVAALLDPALQRGDTPRTLLDKWRQMRGAWALEHGWTKAQILEAYVNLVSFRGELQGVAAAADVLFGKDPHGLTHAESLVLAALIRSPSADRAALMRRALGGDALRQAQGERKRSSQMESNSVRPEPVEGRSAVATAAIVAAVDRVVDAPRGTGPRITLAPHAARRLIPQTAPVPCADTPSTLDVETQRTTADALRRHLLAIRDRSAHDAAVLVADNASGDVLAYVASSGDLSSARHVDGIQAPRQAGSTLKPFLYALALDRHLLTAASLLEDSPLEIATGNGLFRPRDYDEHFRGLVSLRTALAGSLNVPAVRALLLIGPDALTERLRGLGFAGVHQPGDYYGPALALGSADVTLWELVNAYRALANGGVATPLHLRPDHAPPVPAPVYSADTAFVVSDVLADRDSRSVTFGLDNPLATPFWTAVKTGTSKDMRDNWCVGYSRRYTVGVWVGNFSGAPMRDVSGITGAAPIWAEVMSWLHRDLPSDAPAPPPGMRTAVTTFADAAEPPRREWFLAGTEPVPVDAVRAHAPRILAPTDGSVLALDPDIPAPRQRVAFEADACGSGARWRLDGTDAGSAAQLTLWQPVAGFHTLTLVDAGARRLGAVRFEVRGALRRPAT